MNDPIALVSQVRTISPKFSRMTVGQSRTAPMRLLRKLQRQLRAGSLAIAAFGFAGCSASLPDFTQAKLLPDLRSFAPSNSNTFTSSTIGRTLRPVGPGDLVDAQGTCPGMAPPAPPPEAGVVSPQSEPVAPTPPPPRGIALEMTECEVATALGIPQTANIGTNERGDRSVVLSYLSGEHSGIYRFDSGRLVSIERSAEPPVPSKPAKKAAKKASPKKPSAKPPNA